MKLYGRADPILIIILGVLIFAGGLMFASAGLGLLARGATNISSVMFNHFAFGIGLGLIALLIMFLIDYKIWRQFAPYIFGAALIATLLVFVPGLGFEHGGGRRWIDLGITTFQPSELLKIASIIMAAALFAGMRDLVNSWRGLALFAALAAAPTLILAMQPDFGTLGIILMSILAIYIASGARLRYILMIGAIGILALFLVSLTPRYAYVYERIDTFFHPEKQSAQHEGYQIRQSLIAIGSGGFAGRGFGQGVQKFTYLPEPMGDSVFAVVAEEFGFIGASAFIAGFVLLALRGFGIAARAPDMFGALLAVGISVYLVGEAFINIAAMLGLMPLTGIPLTFVSQGGSAMLAALASAGILLSISRSAARAR